MEEIYFDNAATTRTDPEVAALMTHVLCEEYGNPSSLHSRGVQAQLLIERASRQLAAALGMKRGKGRILFTSGGTEANNLALFGAAAALRPAGQADRDYLGGARFGARIRKGTGDARV